MLRNCIISKPLFSTFLLMNDSRQLKFQHVSKYSSLLIAYRHDMAVNKQVMAKEGLQEVNKFVSRTHTCGELTIQNIGENIQLYGWIEFVRLNKFITLRDSYGSTQLIIPDHRTDLRKVIENLTFESVLSVEGTVIKRPVGQENEKMKTGDIEVNVKSLNVLNMAKPNLPFIIRNYNTVKEATQLKYRYISLRYPALQKYLRLRSKVIMRMREYLINDCGFVDIETPTLFKNTPEGAHEFIVPTRIPGYFYSLVQSPQQFKQLLMIGGFDRYFQVARCYRDETPKHDRQPEFTQLDIEMSFTDCKGIMELIENILAYSWPEESGEITIPFKQMKYDDAMELYGIDKPDLRIPQQLQKLTSVIDHSILEGILKIKYDENFEVYGLVFPQKHDYLTTSAKNTLSKLWHDNYPSVKLIQTAIPNKSAEIANIIEGNVIQKLSLKDGDVIFIACGEKFATSLLGKVRLEFTNILESKGQTIRSMKNELLWITDFPLFSSNRETDALQAMHHPFTQPHPDDMHYLKNNPLKVRGLHYDLIMNGSEIAGGSIRIHEAKLQKEILKILNVDQSSLIHILEALESGAPPHGGIAIGLDRLMCLLCNVENIKNVIAFPKTMTGRDLMSGAPDILSDEEKRLYHIKTINENNADSSARDGSQSSSIT